METSNPYQLEVKALSKREFEGHGSVFNNLDLGGDIVVPGAFSKSLAKHRKEGTLPQMYWMHDPKQIPGLWHHMDEDENGLVVRGELADTPLGNEMQVLLSMKAVRGLSIGYRPIDTDWTREGIRLLKEIDLWEVSIVSMAMNPLARVEHVKSRLSRLGEYVPTEREFEAKLRAMWCSRNVAKACVSKVFDSPSGMLGARDQWDAGSNETSELETLLVSMHDVTDRIGAEALRRRR